MNENFLSFWKKGYNQEKFALLVIKICYLVYNQTRDNQISGIKGISRYRSMYILEFSIWSR